MADNKRTIQFEIKVDADAKGADRFARVLKELEASAPIADRELKKVRQGILDFVQATGASERSTKAAEAALRALQREAATGGKLWNQLTKDIGELTGKIRSAEQAKRDLDKALNVNLTATNTFAQLSAATGKLRTELEQLNFRSQDYLRTLVRIKELESVGSFNQGRLNTIAANQAFMGGTLARGYGSSERLPALPDTLAADSLRVSELTQRIQNLDRGSEQYLQTVKELTAAQRQLAAAQEQLNRAVADATRGTALQNARAGLGDLNADFSLRDRARAERARRDAARQAAADRATAAEISLWQDAGRARVTQIRGDNDLRARAAAERERRAAFDQAAQARAAAAETALWQSAGRQRVSQLRYGDDLAARAAAERDRVRAAAEQRRIQQAEAAAAAQQEQARQRELARRNRRRQLGDLGASATAIGVGGFFGGPEGGAGAAIGALFGPGGAQAGATIGLGVASGRQAIGGMATQASELNKLQLSLRGVVGTQAEYAASIQAIEKANRELNVPLVDGTRSFTQLAAAVKGAGGTVADAAIAYNGIASAIKATGGSAQDADGAIRAIVQTFSKGKVSAEEIRGQLAERLPGAVTLFAASIGKTGPELDKMFEQGQVGLNDLMKFLGTLNTRYSDTARQLAASNDEAGLRMQLRWERTTLAIGKAFQPLGAEIQNSIAKALEANQYAIERWATAFAASIKRVADLLSGVQANIDQFGKAINSIPREIRVVANLAVLGPLKELLSLVTGQTVLGTIDSYRRVDQNKKFDPKTYISSLGGSAQATGVFEAEIGKVQDSIKSLRAELAEIPRNLFGQPKDAIAGKQAQAVQGAIDVQLAKLRLLIGETKGRQAGGARQAPTNFAAPAGQGSDSESARRKADAEAERQLRIAEQLAAERQRLLETQTQQEIRLANMVYKHKVDLDNRRYEHLRDLENLRARAEIARLNPQARDVASMFEQFRSSRADSAARIRTLEQELEAAKLEAAAAKKMAAVTAMAPRSSSIAYAPSPSGIIARTGSTGDSTGPHLDARWADGRRITAADADRYLRVNGRAPSSFGVTSGYGPRNLFGRTFHRGIDFGTPSGSSITLQNGAQLLRDLGFTGAGGFAVEIDTPQGRMRLLHLKEGSTSSDLRRTPAGIAAQERRNTVDNGDVAAAALGVSQAEENLRTARQQDGARAQAEWNALVAESTQQLRDNTLATQDNIQQLQDRTRYTLEGFKPEQIEGMVQVNQLQREQTRIMEQLGLEQAKAIQANDPERLRQVNDLIMERANAYNANVAAVQRLTQEQIKSNEALRQLEARKSLIQGIGSTLFNGINSAITSIVSGTREWGEVLKEIASNVLQDIGQQLVSFGLRSLLGGISFGGFSLFGGAFAEGGRPPVGKMSIVGEKGPELFIPDTAGTIVPNYKLAAALSPQAMPQTAMGPIEVKVATQVINGVEYATVDQLRAATRQAAAQGQAMALNRLQRSTKTRKRVGV